MKSILRACCLGAAFLATAGAHARDPRWSEPQPPFRIYGDTWYVGSRGLAAILVTSPKGHVLIDGTLPDNAQLVEANIASLGFKLADIRVILNSHAHFDHAGALAALAKDSGAQVRASAAGALALEAGGNDPDDPQYGEASLYPAVANVVRVADGEAVRVGPLALTAHYTPGHTPGGTSWTWRSCEHGRCFDLVYADSFSAISRDGYRFTDDAAHPHRVEDFRASIATIAALPCDILITPHPELSGLPDRIAARDRGEKPDPVVDPQACKALAAKAQAGLDARLASEKASPKPSTGQR
ncbi:subclass B3 metallo-beta-lactamase [Dokdonella soli]|uniref:CAU/MBL1b family subclass B3 metallo-beta-lactamase n=1 Tax=Dokdonella soli TaxID=529810 RepID=A0ABN1IK46_9GAMM